MSVELNLFHQVSLPDQPGRFPAIFLLHGMGGDESNLLPILAPFRATHVIIAVRGPRPHGGGFTYFYPKSYGNPDRASFDPALVELTQFFRDAVQQYPIDPEQIFVVGFSQGAIMGMSLSLATELPIKGVVALHGYIPQFIMEQAPQSVATAYFISQGERDPIFPVTVGRETQGFLAPRSGDVTYLEYPVGHEVSQAMVADLTDWLSGKGRQVD